MVIIIFVSEPNYSILDTYFDSVQVVVASSDAKVIKTLSKVYQHILNYSKMTAK